jgi:uncharacterized membrane protein
MNLAPLLAAPAIIQLHAGAAVAALLLGIAQLSLPKGTGLHRTMGWIWAALMLAVAVSSFWISGERFRFGPFGPIHLLSILTLVSLPLGLFYARRHNVRGHRTTMISLFAAALIVAGLFTLLPSRLLGRVVFG